MFVYILFIIFLLLSLVLFEILRWVNILFLDKKYTKKYLFLISLFFTFVYFLLLVFARSQNPEFTRILYYYLGFLNFAFFSSIFVLILWFAYKKLFKSLYLEKYLKYIFLIIFLFSSFLSIYNFSNISVENYKIYSDKIDKNYNFVHLSDIQYWTVSKKYLEKVINLANAQNPDFIVFTWDLVDFNEFKKEDFSIFSKLEVPLYFERWNHEFYHFPDKLMEYVKSFSQIYILDNKKISFDKDIDIVWIDYNNRVWDRFEENLSKIEIDKSNFNILLYHSPENVELWVYKWFDLQLYGHTHAWQIWPFTKVVDFIYDYADWFFEIWNTKIYTTDWAALWWPKMRLWSQNEITVFEILKK